MACINVAGANSCTDAVCRATERPLTVSEMRDIVSHEQHVFIARQKQVFPLAYVNLKCRGKNIKNTLLQNAVNEKDTCALDCDVSYKVASHKNFLVSCNFSKYICSSLDILNLSIWLRAKRNTK